MSNSLVLFFILFDINGFSQVYSPAIKMDTLNKSDSDKTKVGYWIQPLDKYTLPAQKKEKVVFYRYAYYEKNEFGKKTSWSIYPNDFILPKTYRLFENGSYKMKMEDSNAIITRQDTIIALNGTYFFYHKQYLIEEEKYKDGFMQYYKAFRRTGELFEYWNYEQKDTVHLMSYTKTNYKKNGEIIESVHRYRLNGQWHTESQTEDGKSQH